MAEYAENCFYYYRRYIPYDDEYYEKFATMDKKCSEEKAFFDLIFYASGFSDYGISNPYNNVL